MEQEIIKTEDPNIVIERTVVDKEIKINELLIEKARLEDSIENLNERLAKLRLVSFPIELYYLRDKEEAEIVAELSLLQEKLNETNSLLNKCQ